MKSKKQIKNVSLNFRIDKLTNSIENIITGDSFPTNVQKATLTDLKYCTKHYGWLFHWKNEFLDKTRIVFKLAIVNNSHVVQGLVSLSVNADHVFMHLLESAPYNRGKKKMYRGVPGNLVAFACKLSFEQGCEGFVSFKAKSALIDHYINTLGAAHAGNQIMIINKTVAQQLTFKYFKE